MWIGVAMQKNGLGRLCMIVAFFLIWSLVRRWQGRNPAAGRYQTPAELAVLALTLYLITGGQKTSATSLISLAMGLMTYAAFTFLKKKGKTISATLLILVVGLVIAYGTITLFTGQMELGFIASAAGRDETLTGRTDVWARLLPVAMSKPIFGGGFGGFWTPETMDQYRISGSHNGYLDILIGLGLVGLVLVSLFLFTSCRKAIEELNRDFDWGILWIGYIIMAVMHNISESSIYSFAMHLTALILFFTVISSGSTSIREAG